MQEMCIVQRSSPGSQIIVNRANGRRQKIRTPPELGQWEPKTDLLETPHARLSGPPLPGGVGGRLKMNDERAPAKCEIDSITRKAPQR